MYILRGFFYGPGEERGKRSVIAATAGGVDRQRAQTLETEALVRELGSTADRGLDPGEAGNRLRAYGANRLPEQGARPLWSLFLSQLRELLVLMLVAAALISGLLGEVQDAAVIMAIVVLNAGLGTYQEHRAEQALQALKELVRPRAQVWRGGRLESRDPAELVPGDVLEVAAGDAVPADARLLESHYLQVNESSLTGESVAVSKDTGPRKPEEEAGNLVFMGTIITAGRARVLVYATGESTELGRIAHLIQAAGTEATPLQKRMQQLGKVLGAAAAVVVALVFATGLWRGIEPLEMFMTAVSLAVAAVPEGLPAVVTVVLALGVTRMSRRQAVVRRLSAVETLGAATVICTDKTGTLTRNEMTVVGAVTDGRLETLPGPMNPRPSADEGQLTQGPGEIVSASGPDPGVTENGLDPRLEELLRAGALNNDSRLGAEGTLDGSMGDPTETALLLAAARAGLDPEGLRERYPREGEVPFDAERRRMSTLHRLEEGPTLLVKGAPDEVLARCTRRRTGAGEQALDEAGREELARWNQELAGRGLRVLAVARRGLGEDQGRSELAAAENNLTWLGLLALEDPPRAEAAAAVAGAQAAGIRTLMNTGDHPETARAIARRVGILQEGDRVLTGRELDTLTETELEEALPFTSVYARVSPQHKLRIVQALQRQDQVVAMTGDGVNDGPALKQADIGVAMGRTGTEVARQAADMVLLDDNYATLVAAVSEGRTIYANILRTVHYLLSCNTGEIVAIFGAILLGWGSPLAPIQILWLNLVTDGPPALALGMEPAEPGLMERRPRPRRAGVFTGGVAPRLVRQGALMGLISLAAFGLALLWGRDTATAQTMTLVTMALAQLVHAFNTRSPHRSLLQLGLFSNRSLNLAVGVSALLQLAVVYLPALNAIFHTAPLAAPDLAVALGLALLPLPLVEAGKRL